MRIYLNMLTASRLTTVDERRDILQSICQFYPALMPERYGSEEPLRMVFDPNHIEDALKNWQEPFLWKRRALSVEGGVFMGTVIPPLHGWITVSVNVHHADPEKLERLFLEWAMRLKADFACLHCLAQQEIEIGRLNGTVAAIGPKGIRYNINITTHHLVRFLPDLYWGTFFGRPYTELFGRNVLLRAPVPTVRELDHGGIYLRLSDDPLDTIYNFEKLDTTRQQVKRYLNHNAFFDVDLPLNHDYLAPRIHFPPKPPFG